VNRRTARRRLPARRWLGLLAALVAAGLAAAGAAILAPDPPAARADRPAAPASDAAGVAPASVDRVARPEVAPPASHHAAPGPLRPPSRQDAGAHRARQDAAAERGRPPEAAIVWHRSRAIGLPYAGRLAGGVELPAEGTHFATWDPVRRLTPNRAWRRHGTDRLVRLLLRVAERFAAAHPDAPRLLVGDLSRPRGGGFGRRFGGDGHRSHQNGLDVDVYYPRRDGLERAPIRVAQIDRRLAQDLVDRLVRAGAQYVFVGPNTGLRGPHRVVTPLGNHDDHLHLRIRPNHPRKLRR
jgi:hypothetical protein